MPSYAQLGPSATDAARTRACPQTACRRCVGNLLSGTIISSELRHNAENLLRCHSTRPQNTHSQRQFGGKLLLVKRNPKSRHLRDVSRPRLSLALSFGHRHHAQQDSHLPTDIPSPRRGCHLAFCVAPDNLEMMNTSGTWCHLGRELTTKASSARGNGAGRGCCPQLGVGTGDANFGQTKFGPAVLLSLASTNLGQTKFAQYQVWPDFVFNVEGEGVRAVRVAPRSGGGAHFRCSSLSLGVLATASHTTARQLKVLGLQTPPTFHEKTPEREKKSENGSGTWKKREILGAEESQSGGWRWVRWRWEGSGGGGGRRTKVGPTGPKDQNRAKVGQIGIWTRVGPKIGLGQSRTSQNRNGPTFLVSAKLGLAKVGHSRVGQVVSHHPWRICSGPQLRTRVRVAVD